MNNLEKFELMGKRGNINSWFESTITDREIMVKFESQMSTEGSHGEVFYQHLFFLFVNDMIKYIRNHCRNVKIVLYADDCKTSITVETNENLDSILYSLVLFWG